MGKAHLRHKFFVWFVIISCLTVLLAPQSSSAAVPQSNKTTVGSEFPILTLGDSTPAVTQLHEMLAQLGYLPVEFVPMSPVDRLYSSTVQSPAAGTWQWKYASWPKELKALWDPTVYSEITKGAVMTFQKEHHIPMDGFAGPKVFRSIQIALKMDLQSEHEYTYVQVKQSVPQRLSVWRDGKVVYTSTCSTGIPAAATHTGTHVIYLRNPKQKMEGTSPSGRHYRVENVPYVSFFYKGEAIHGLQRTAYGMPQSVGCVELPIDNAKAVWNLTDYGTLVTILDAKQS